MEVIYYTTHKMKKAFIFLIVILITNAIIAQTSNSFKYVINAKGGINVSLKAASADKVDSVKVSSGSFKMYQGATQLVPDIPAGSLIDNDTVYAKRDIVDTVHLTGSRAIPLTYRGQWISVTKATEARIYIPADTAVNFPVGTVINFSMDGAGIVHFVKGTGVVFQSVKDSVCINSQNGVVTIVKRAANKWRLFGTLTD